MSSSAAAAPPDLVDDLVEEVLLRLPPEEPAWLVRSSAVCKPWRRILASPRFRRRYRKFHRAPPLLGFFQGEDGFVPTSSFLPAQPYHPGWDAVESRHGRALFIPCVWDPDEAFQLLVVDPVTGHSRRVTSPVPVDSLVRFRAAVLCSGHGCDRDHHSCQGRHFRVAFVAADEEDGFTAAWLYSSETGLWGKPTSLHRPIVKYTNQSGSTSILVDDALYFNINIHGVIKYELGTLCLSMFDVPLDGKGSLMTTEHGGLGFAAVVDSNLTLWSRNTGLDGAMGWQKLRIIDLETLVPGISSPIFRRRKSSGPCAWVRGSTEGTQVLFLGKFLDHYIFDLKSGLARKVATRVTGFCPYMNFYIPEMEAASMG